MKKRILLCFLIIATLTFSLLSLNKVNASETNIKASFLIDYNSKTVISSYNENARLPIASMTKIMLLNLIYKNEKQGNVNFEEEITISDRASSMGGSQVFLVAGETYKVKDLVKSIVVASANDSSVALAERLYGSEEECVKAMNLEAKNLGLTNTCFQNCTGLPKPMHYSSAKDIGLIFCNLLSYDKYFESSKIWLDYIKHKQNETEMANTNKLIRYYEGCDGGKTGYTNEAGFCLTATAKRGNMRLVATVIGADTSKTRFKCVSDMFNDGFNNYSNKCVIDSSVPFESKLKVLKGKKEEIEVIAKENFYIFSKKNQKQNLEILNEFNSVKAPVKKGDKVGEAIIYKEGVEVGKVDIISNESVESKNFTDYILDIVRKMC